MDKLYEIVEKLTADTLCDVVVWENVLASYNTAFQNKLFRLCINTSNVSLKYNNTLLTDNKEILKDLKEAILEQNRKSRIKLIEEEKQKRAAKQNESIEAAWQMLFEQ